MAIVELIFEKSHKGRTGNYYPAEAAIKSPESILPPALLRKNPPSLPEVSELEFVRHILALSRRQVGIDSTFYPLGSCTMKYNPKINEAVARDPGFAAMHPLQPAETAQGTLEVFYELERGLSNITGMDEVTLNPLAGAHGELTGIMLIKAYHESRGDTKRKKVLVPTAAHGTNPASAALCGYDVVSIPGTEAGEVDLAGLDAALDDTVSALMLTNPNTLGLFESQIRVIQKKVHDAGGLLYYDGANLNAILGVARPGDMGFDVVHLNLHKTFSTPHGGGGPGAGPVGVKQRLRPFLPVPYVKKIGDTFELASDRPETIGRVSTFQGNANVLVRAYTYMRHHGSDGLPEVGKNAVLNAAYVLQRLAKTYRRPMASPCMHEFILQPTEEMLAKGVRTLHIAKRLIDYGFHPPTIYFPLVVKEALMIEPTETESKATLDKFCEAMEAIAKEALEKPELVIGAPHTTVVGKVDETKAAKDLDLRFCGCE
ncbi:MAG TPA: aminomethyl-transferring glycine dehydrogenase subunit GcvPB [Planctomycetota bacterium]|nr:aminomethyl-transferring glycine dehydrogenase subunit GcvPB [Planctomycetota bacterium]